MRILKLTDDQYRALQLLMESSADLQPATEKQLADARKEWVNFDEVVIQDDALVNNVYGGYWIEAWVWMDN